MTYKLIFLIASLLYKYVFFVYKPLYFWYKSVKDKTESKLFAKWLTLGDEVVDIGANIGSSSLVFSKIVGRSGKIHSFEPDLQNYKYLQQNCLEHKNIKLNNLAVSNSSKPLLLYTSKALNVDHRTYPSDGFANVYKVSSTTLDSYVVRNRIRHIALLKIDVQGAEYQVLQGAKTTIKKNGDLIIFMELWPKGLKLANTKISILIDFFSKLNMTVFVIRENCLQKLTNKIVKEYSGYREFDFDNWIVSKRKLNEF